MEMENGRPVANQVTAITFSIGSFVYLAGL
jgi:hypothetical protein